MRNIHSGTVEFSTGLRTMLAFPMQISFLTHKNAFACITLVAHNHPVICSCLQEHLPSLMFPNWSRKSRCSTWHSVPYFYSAVLHVWFIDVGLSLSSVRASAGMEHGSCRNMSWDAAFCGSWMLWNPEHDVDNDCIFWRWKSTYLERWFSAI